MGQQEDQAEEAGGHGWPWLDWTDIVISGWTGLDWLEF